MFYTNSQSSLENENASRLFKRLFRREGQVPTTTSTTQLQFRDGDDEDTMTRRQEHDAAAATSRSSPQSRYWLQTVFPPADVPAESVDSEQDIVDDYLVFLDRRYHRLHDDVEAKGAKFSAWKWLMQGNEGSEDQVIVSQAEKEDDALYVLGVAGLASQRLLQKHQHHPVAPAQKSAATSVDRALPSFAVDADMTVLPSTRLSVVASIAVARATPVLQRVLKQRRALILFESVKAQAALKFLVRKVVVAPFKAMKSAVELGGGKQNISTTLTVAAALSFVLFRPVLQAVVSERRA
jgi:hypothetical protein